jgi:hypothetical protein
MSLPPFLYRPPFERGMIDHPTRVSASQAATRLAGTARARDEHCLGHIQGDPALAARDDDGGDDGVEDLHTSEGVVAVESQAAW